MDGEGTQRFRKNQKFGSIYTIVQQLHEDWQPFKIHRLVKLHQEGRFNYLRTLKDNSTLLLQFDFSENAEIV